MPKSKMKIFLGKIKCLFGFYNWLYDGKGNEYCWDCKRREKMQTELEKMKELAQNFIQKADEFIAQMDKEKLKNSAQYKYEINLEFPDKITGCCAENRFVGGVCCLDDRFKDIAIEKIGEDRLIEMIKSGV